jgi:hypothetical protein
MQKPRFTIDEVLMGRVSFAQLSKVQQSNLKALIERCSTAFIGLKMPLIVSSGYRSPAINAAVPGSAKRSLHMDCAALDIADVDGRVRDYCLANLQTLKTVGLWLEDPRWTPTWIHVQIYAPKSGRRIFIPDSSAPKAPKAWSGVYDSSLD